MIKFENQITINLPISDVFPFVTNLENIPKWNYFVQSVSKTSPGSSGIGSVYHQVRKNDNQNLKIVELNPNKNLVVETIPPSKPNLHREMVFHARVKSTIIVDRWELSFGLFGPLEMLAGNRVKSAVNENLIKLKELLETGNTILQDGRSVAL